MNNFELMLYKFIDGEGTNGTFEQWLYTDNRFENSLSSHDYLELICLDYKSRSSFNKAEEIVKKYINLGKYYEWRLRKILQMVIERSPDVHEYIVQCYDLYCDGYNFLDNLGIGYGFNIVNPPSNYNSDTWKEMLPSEKLKLIDSFYPNILKEVDKVIYWLDSEKIILTGYDDENCEGIQYQDYRTQEEKEPSAYKISCNLEL